MSNNPNNRLLCPNCGSRQVGEVGPQRHYCRSCYVEFDSGGEDNPQVYLIDDEGNLFSFEDSVQEAKDDH